MELIHDSLVLRRACSELHACGAYVQARWHGRPVTRKWNSFMTLEKPKSKDMDRVNLLKGPVYIQTAKQDYEGKVHSIW